MSHSINSFFDSFWNKHKEEKEDEENKSSGKAGEMSGKADEVKGLIEDKFGAFYTLKDFISEFWNAIQNSGDAPPSFSISLPSQFGGGTHNVLDLSFYNNYRNYIHGIIAGICYFVYIKRILTSIPNVIKS